MLEKNIFDTYDANSPENPNPNLIKINIQISRFNILSQKIQSEAICIFIDKTQSIFDLISLLKNFDDPENSKKYRIFFHGSEISKNSAFSLAFYEINNDDYIQVIEKDISELQIQEQSLQSNVTNNNFQSFCKNRARAMEQARLHDVLFNRIEGTLLCYRKNVDRYMQTYHEKQSDDDNSETIIDDSSQEPSTHMLPQIWPGEATECSKN